MNSRTSSSSFSHSDCFALPALSADTIGSLTKTAWKKLGVPTNFRGPHSTRGAGVSFYKQLGLTSEEVCEIGKWKSSNAFQSHYLRLGASKTASGRVSNFLHTVSPVCSAEPDQSRTPARPPEPGGSDWEGEVQDQVSPPTCPWFSFKTPGSEVGHPPSFRGVKRSASPPPPDQVPSKRPSLLTFADTANRRHPPTVRKTAGGANL